MNIEGAAYRFLRIRNTPIIEVKSKLFSKVLIVPSMNKELSLILLEPLKPKAKNAVAKVNA